MVEAKVTWSDGMRFDATATSAHSLVLDAAAEMGGKGRGFRPMELLLVGLAGCTAMDVLAILQKKRQAVTGFEVKVTGDRATDHPQVYTNAHIEYVVRGRSIDPRAIERAVELSETKYCSAQAQLRPTMPITHSYRIVEEEPVPVEG